MPWKRLQLKTFILGCFKAKHPSSDLNVVSKKISSRRLSLSDLSNSSSLSIISNSLIGSNLHIFTYKELKEITHNFSKSSVLGEGGFGKVYKGFIDDKLKLGLVAQVVAVKALDLDGKQGHREWLAEVIFLGQLKHPHLVNLIGYCCEDEHRLLVYEYMEQGNLEEKLFKGYLATLPWLTRINIATGAAKGLAFLHEEEKPVIYRDFKASNILLDADYNAKLSDFGLAIDGPAEDQTHITTRVMGTHGYAAPEYIMTGHLTTMSDVYSFGVVLLELLTGKRSVDKKRPTREQDLVEWARPLLKDSRKLKRILDPRLEGQYSTEGMRITCPHSLSPSLSPHLNFDKDRKGDREWGQVISIPTEGARKLAALAYQCLSHQPKCRPSMRTVVKTLEALMDLTNIPVGHFVYVVPNEKHEQEKHKGRHRHLKSRGHSHQVKPLRRSPAVYSDTALYKTLGTSLYSPQQAQTNGDGPILA